MATRKSGNTAPRKRTPKNEPPTSSDRFDLEVHTLELVRVVLKRLSRPVIEKLEGELEKLAVSSDAELVEFLEEVQSLAALGAAAAPVLAEATAQAAATSPTDPETYHPSSPHSGRR